MTIKNNIKYGILLIGALSLLTLVVLGLSNFSDGSTKLANNPTQDSPKLVNNDKPLYAEVSTSLLGFNYTELSNRSDTIVIGTVKETLPSKWNTVDGKKSDPDVKFSPFNVIYTDIIISVDEYVKNQLSTKEVRVRVEGGTVGNDTLVVDYEPEFEPGEKVLLYLMKDDKPGTQNIGPEHFIMTGCVQGKFTLTDDGKAMGFDGKTIGQNELLSTIENRSAV